MAPKILVVLTSQAKMNNGNPTGWYLVSFITTTCLHSY
jgi:hypothetical protein